MRITVEFLLNEDTIDKDKNRIFVSILKNSLKNYDDYIYRKMFESGPVRKTYTFSLYMRDAKFTKDKILIPDKKILFKLSTADLEDAIHLYNSLLQNINKTFTVKENVLKLNRVNIDKEKRIYDEQAVFTSLSPIIARKHEGSNKDTWYFSINEEEGKTVLLNNLKIQLSEKFGQERTFDIEDVKIEVLNNKEVKVKNYGIVVIGNLCKLRICAKPYILEHIYKSGLGGHKNMGFGMLDLL